jgi:bla regulator protein blaR1
MTIWIQSLSWTLIYALGQGFVVYLALWLLLKLMPGLSARSKYHLSLSALTILLAWFAGTWWQQFHVWSHVRILVAPAAFADRVLYPAAGSVAQSVSYRPALAAVTVFFPWISAAYLLGLIFMLLRLYAGTLQLFSLKKNGLSEPDAARLDLLDTLKRKLHITRPVQFFVAAKAQVPMVVGYIRPMILMPAAALARLSTAQLETILLHELAHIKRQDYLVNILQTLVETILFFNPFVWMISAIIRRERELCCDDLVLVHTREPLFYATALAALADHPGTVPAYALGASGQRNQLFHRIKRIMEMKKNPFSYSRMVAAVLIVAVITCATAWLTPSFARSEKEKATELRTTGTDADPNAALLAREEENNQLIKRLTDDQLVDANKGFTIVKRQKQLYINGLQQAPEVAEKYLQQVKQEDVFIEVYSFRDWMSQHPEFISTPGLFPSKRNNSGKPGC